MKNDKLLHSEGKIYDVVGSDGDWSVIDFPKLAPGEDWKKIWSSLMEILTKEGMAGGFGTQMKVKSNRMLAFDRKIWHYHHWFTAPNLNYKGKEANGEPLKGQMELFNPKNIKNVVEKPKTEKPSIYN